MTRSSHQRRVSLSSLFLASTANLLISSNISHAAAFTPSAARSAIRSTSSRRPWSCWGVSRDNADISRQSRTFLSSSSVEPDLNPLLSHLEEEKKKENEEQEKVDRKVQPGDVDGGFSTFSQETAASWGSATTAEVTAPPWTHRQLWLDLTDTALFPSEAASFLNALLKEEQEEPGKEVCNNTDDVALWDKVIVTEDTFRKLCNGGNTAAGSDDDKYLSSLLYLTSTGDLVANDPTVQQSVPIGRVVTFQQHDNKKEGLDPLLALDTTSKGQWLLIDPSDSSDSDDYNDGHHSSWITQVGNLMEFLSLTATSSIATASSTSSLLLPSILMMPSTLPSQTSLFHGGVAIRCSSKSGLVQLNAILTKSLYARLTTVTDSGILVPTLSTRSSSSSGGGGGGRGVDDDGLRPAHSQMLHTALVLPLDVRLWKAALELKQDTALDMIQ